MSKITKNKRKPTSNIQEANKPVSVTAATHFQGPIPSPQDMAAYEKVHPGSVKIILDNWINESIHRRNIDNKCVNEEYKIQIRGQIFGLILGLGALTSCTITAIFDHPITAALLGAGGLSGLVSAFVFKKKSKNN